MLVFKHLKIILLYFHTSGSSFYRADNIFLRKAIDIARPGLKMPDRKKIGNELLDRSYNIIKEKTEALINDSTTFTTLCTDGWTNIKRSSIVNYIACNPEFTLFLEAIDLSKISHSANLATDANRIMDKHPTVKWSGMVFIF